MCDPVSLLGFVGGLVGSNKSKPAPPPEIPDKAPVQAKAAAEDTGAEVLIGADGRKKRKATVARGASGIAAKTIGSGLNVRNRGTGISIL